MNLKALKGLFLENNKLKFISADLFSSMVNLTAGDFTNNECIDMAYPNQTMEEIETKFADACILPSELNCFYSQEPLSISEMLAITGNMSKAESLSIQNQRTVISKSNCVLISHI